MSKKQMTKGPGRDKRQEKLDTRIRNYEDMVLKMSPMERDAYTRPGSLNRRNG